MRRSVLCPPQMIPAAVRGLVTALVAGPAIALILLGVRPAVSAAGVSIGARAGWSHANGSTFTGAQRLNGVDLFGAQAILKIVPIVSLQIAGEGRNRSFDFQNSPIGGTLLAGRAKWTDLALFATARIRIVPLTLGPLGTYAGVGLGAHFAQTKINSAQIVTSPAALAAGDAFVPASTQSDPVTDFIKEQQKKHNNLAWHALAGVNLGLPVLPLSLFAEGRFEQVAGRFTPDSFALLGGVNVDFP